MSDKVYVGTKASQLESMGTLTAISRVTLLVDDDNYYTAGDDTGLTLEKTNPHATQAMADSILAQIKGYQHKPYEAQDALLDPAAELGDGVTIGGLYSVIGEMTVDFGPAHTTEISAPGSKETDEEFGVYVSQTDREINRKIAKTRSLISKTAEEIRLNVSNDMDGLSSSIDVQLSNIRSEISGKLDEGAARSLIDQALDSITLSVSSSNGSTTIQLTSDGVEISGATVNLSVNAANISGTLTANQIDATDLKVSAANITGTLTIGQLPSTVAETSDIPTKTSQLTNNSGYTTSSQVTTITNNAISTASISADQITTGTLNASSISMNGFFAAYHGSSIYGYFGATTVGQLPGVVVCDSTESVYLIAATSGVRMSYQNEYEIWVCDTGCWTSSGIVVYSDERLKNSISYDVEKYEPFFDALKPAFFKLNAEGESAKYRLGFVAQDVQSAALDNGLENDDLALLMQTDSGYYGLSYGEFTALSVWKIQKLESRVAELERKIAQ